MGFCRSSHSRTSKNYCIFKNINPFLMKQLFVLAAVCFGFLAPAQIFTRSELATSLTTPWEIIYGPDGFLWITEAGGKVVRVDPASGSKTTVYTAPDYFGGSTLEQSPLCFQPPIGAGTLGMALHPDFTNPATAFIYFVYSYNSGSSSAPVTKFKIERLTWNGTTQTVISNTTLVSSMPTGYDHLGGRLMIAKVNNTPYLFFSVGDNGVSEANNPDCYSPQSTNPNIHAQDPNYKNGKIHRFNLDGSIPADNPIAGNSFYTRGHRNPQGLMYNPVNDVIYDVEHGDRTDDEVNVLLRGMNYGWKDIRGYRGDGNFPGEVAYAANYVPNPQIAGDALQDPIYSWCTVPQPSVVYAPDWCTIAPSDGIYYGSSGISDWTHSLLVVNLKDGTYEDIGVYQLKLTANGLGIDTSVHPNPKLYFNADQAHNGRLRDIAISPDGKTIYLINNGGSDGNGGTLSDKITVYAYQGGSGIVTNTASVLSVALYPNPAGDWLKIKSTELLESVVICDLIGKQVIAMQGNATEIDLPGLAAGTYICHVRTVSGYSLRKKIVKE